MGNAMQNGYCVPKEGGAGSRHHPSQKGSPESGGWGKNDVELNKVSRPLVRFGGKEQRRRITSVKKYGQEARRKQVLTG